VKRTTILILTIIFALLTLISLIGIYFAHQQPTEEKKAITLCTYTHDGKYDYIAALKPNNLYNLTTLLPGEGTLYIRITKSINVTFTYTFNCSLPANITLQYVINEYMQSPKWKKAILTSPTETLNFSEATMATFATTQSINITALEELRNSIDKETGTYTSEHLLVLEPIINVTAKTAVGEINEPFTPAMNMSFRYGTPEGDYIAIEGLTHTQQGRIQQTETIYHPEVMSQRYVSYALSIAFISALTCATWAYLKAKPEKHAKPEKPIEEIIAPYEETIFELAEEPSYESFGRTVVRVETLEDLVSIADGLAKPILYLKKTPSKPEEKTSHVFYVLDGPVRYEYKVAGD
jgi:hypothetical protein